MDILSVRNRIKREGISFKDLPLRVAFYARVSTDFLEQFNSLENIFSNTTACLPRGR